MALGQRPSSRIFGAALLLPLILFSALGTGFQLWRCRFDGVARTSCCCPTKPGTQQAEQRLTMSRARCCDLEQHQIDRDPAEAARGQATRLSDLLAAATSAVPVSPLLLRSDHQLRACASPRRGRTAGWTFARRSRSSRS